MLSSALDSTIESIKAQIIRTLTFYSGPGFEGAKACLCQELKGFLEHLDTAIETESSPFTEFDIHHLKSGAIKDVETLLNNEPIFDCDIVDNREIQNESPSVNHETFDQEMLYVSLPELELHVQGLRPGGSEPESLSTSPSISATLMSGISSPDGQFSEDSHSSVTYDEMVLDSSVEQSDPSCSLNTSVSLIVEAQSEAQSQVHNLLCSLPGSGKDFEVQRRENCEQHIASTMANAYPLTRLSRNLSPERDHGTSFGPISRQSQRQSQKSESGINRKSDLLSSMVLQNFSRLPALETVERIFASRLKSSNQMCSEFLSRMFYAVASRDAFLQLAEAAKTARQAFGLQFCVETADPSTLSKILDKLDATSFLAYILRRYCLVRLLRYRHEREYLYQQERRQPKRKRRLMYDLSAIDTLHIEETPPLGTAETSLTTQSGTYQRADSLALSDLMSTVYPGLEDAKNKSPRDVTSEYSRKRSKLKSRLCCARNWYRIEQQFSVGILVLIPRGGEFDISIEQFEKLNSDSLRVFLNVLQEFRGPFLEELSHRLSKQIFGILTGQQLDVIYRFEMCDQWHGEAFEVDSPATLEYITIE